MTQQGGKQRLLHRRLNMSIHSPKLSKLAIGRRSVATLRQLPPVPGFSSKSEHRTLRHHTQQRTSSCGVSSQKEITD